ncbi:hypothetical protein OS21_37230 [Dickeya oryzae]
MLPELTDEETLRYNRQIVLRGFDFDAQERLKAARVLIVGLGGLGCAASQYLASAGVGQLTLLDFDTVSLSNLQRQVLHRDDRIGMPKVESARQTLQRINPHVQITPIQDNLDDDALQAVVTQHDVVVDCTDNVSIRERLNHLCFLQKIPLVSGAAIRMEGQISVFYLSTAGALLPLSQPFVWRQCAHLCRSGCDGTVGWRDRIIAGAGNHQVAGALWPAAGG